MQINAKLSLLSVTGHRSNGSAMREDADGQTDGQIDGRYQVHYLPASQSMKIRLT